MGVFKSIKVLAAVAIAVSTVTAQQLVWDGSTATNWTGAGTEQNPYVITTAAQLAGLAAAVRAGDPFTDKHIRLGNDILLNHPNTPEADRKEWAPIGRHEGRNIVGGGWTFDLNPFSGTFDGAGFTVSGVYCGTMPDNSDWDDWFNWLIGMGFDFSGWYMGLFGYVNGGAIKNLNIADVKVVGVASVGGLVGHIKDGTIINCSVVGGLVVGNEATTGGLAGWSEGNTIIDNCRSTAEVTGVVVSAGGLVGANSGRIINSHATGNVTGLGRGMHTSSAGGLVATNSGHIERSYSTGNVNGSGALGGFAGTNTNTGTITLSYSTGNVEGSGWNFSGIGGFVARNCSGGLITDSYATGNVHNTSNTPTGGFVGTNSLVEHPPVGTIINCFATGNVTNAVWSAGRTAGFGSGDIMINNWYNSQKSGTADLRGGGGPRTTAQMQSQGFVDTLNMVAGLFGLSTWIHTPGQYPKPSGTKATLTAFDGGNGSENNPWLIRTKRHLENFRFIVNVGYDFKDKHIKVTSNIELNAPNWEINAPTPWTPIGRSFSHVLEEGTSWSTSHLVQTPFRGTFDGGGYEISGLYVDNQAMNNQGLFGYIEDATIKNLGVVNAYVAGYDNVGILVGHAIKSTIDKCYTTGVKNAGTPFQVVGRWNAGGLIGQGNEAAISNSYAIVDVRGTQSGGGFMGLVRGSVKNCFAMGNINASSGFGWNNQIEIENCFFVGNRHFGLSDHWSFGVVSVNVFYDGETSGQSDSTNGARPKSTAFMQSKELVNALNYWVSANNARGGEQYLYWQHNQSGYPTFTPTVTQAHHNITFNSNGGTNVATQKVLSESKAVIPSSIVPFARTVPFNNRIGFLFDYPAKDGYTFGGWYRDAGLQEIFVFDEEVVESNITLHAQWFQNFVPDTTWYTNNTFPATFTITTAEQLAGLALLVNGSSNNRTFDFEGKTIRLGNDIMLNDTTNWKQWGNNASAREWQPIGAYLWMSGNHVYREFRGTFDGNGHKISGVYINMTTDTATIIRGHVVRSGNLGLFGTVGQGGEIKNLGVVASFVNGNAGNIGGLAGQNGGIIINCYSAANVIGHDAVGGLVGRNRDINWNNGNIIGSYATGNVTATGANFWHSNAPVGGLVGVCGGGNIVNSYATGNVTGMRGSAGGLVGDKQSGSITNSYATGNVTGAGSSIGGLAGNASGAVRNSYATGNVSHSSGTGSTIGGLRGSGVGTVTNSFYNSETSGFNVACTGITPLTTAQMQNQDFTDMLNDWVLANNASLEFLYWQHNSNNYPTFMEGSPTIFTITFDSRGGTAVTARNAASGMRVNAPAVPTKTDSAFAGWYLDTDLTQRFDFPAVITGNITLFAKWQQVWNSATPPNISNWTGENNILYIAVNASGTLNVPENVTGTIMSNGAVNNGTRAITLNIPVTSKIIWLADYSGSGTLVTLNNDGVFEIAGGKITETGGNVAVNVTGTNSTIIVRGGTIETTSNWTSDRAIDATGANNKIIVNGGTVAAAAGRAIRLSNNSTAFISGGAVTANNADSRVVANGNNAVGIERIATTNTYKAGSSTDLTIFGSGARVVWNVASEKNGISYSRGTNAGFIEIAGITIENCSVCDRKSCTCVLWNNTAPDISNLTGNNNFVEIAAGASGTLNLPENTTITITSKGAVDNEWRSITLNIPATSKVIWRAELSGSGIVTVDGNGNFEMIEGSINSSGWALYVFNSVFALINGGSVTATSPSNRVWINGNNAILVERTATTNSYTTNTSTDLTITGNGATAVWSVVDDKHGISYSRGSNTGFIEIAGVTVENCPDCGRKPCACIIWNSATPPNISALTGNDNVVFISSGASGTLNIPENVTLTIASKGAVNNEGRTITLNILATSKVVWKADLSSSWNAVSIAGNGKFELVEGSINATSSNFALWLSGTDAVAFISGGSVTATSLNNRFGISGSNAIAIERTTTTNTYKAGSSTDLTIFGSGARVVWNVANGKTGISYTRGTNTGFIEVAGITIENCLVCDRTPCTCALWNSEAPDISTLTGNVFVEIAAGANGTLNVPENTTVTITSNGAVDNSGRNITLDIPATSKVVWKADYNWVVIIDGGGEFEITEGAISVASAGAIDLRGGRMFVTGGTVKTTAGQSNERTIVVGSNSAVFINGGTVSSVLGAVIGLNGTNSTAFINGGTVSSVFGQIISIGFFGAQTIAIERIATTNTYTAGTSTDLTITGTSWGSNATAFWNIVGGKHGISYTVGTNTGFIEVAGVTVEAVMVSVEFNSNGGSAISAREIVAGTTTSAPAAPTLDGHRFVGWYSDEALTTAFNFATPITANITLYAKWREIGGLLSLPYENNINSTEDVIEWTLSGVTWDSADNGRLVFATMGSSATMPELSAGYTGMRVTISARWGNWIYLYTSSDGITYTQQGLFNGNSSSISSSSMTIPDGTRFVRFVARQGTGSDVFLVSVSITASGGKTSILTPTESNRRYGIKFAKNIVSDKAAISVILPDASTGSATVVIYDMTGNVVFVGATALGRPLSWDLRNTAGRFVANGTYLVIAEAKDRNGRTYQYSARLGVKR